MLDIQDFENQPEMEKSKYVDELYQTLTELEDEYQWTQNPNTKLQMMSITREINDLLRNF